MFKYILLFLLLINSFLIGIHTSPPYFTCCFNLIFVWKEGGSTLTSPVISLNMSPHDVNYDRWWSIHFNLLVVLYFASDLHFQSLYLWWVCLRFPQTTRILWLELQYKSFLYFILLLSLANVLVLRKIGHKMFPILFSLRKMAWPRIVHSFLKGGELQYLSFL